MRRIMYVEAKTELDGPGRIGCVELTRSGRSYVYSGRRFAKVGNGNGYKYNCIDSETGAPYWVSGPRKDGADKLYGGVVQIDEDARVEYWLKVREKPSLVHLTEYRAGAHSRTGGKERQIAQYVGNSAARAARSPRPTRPARGPAAR
jgi:hypothetical protein